ncbi:hypothetical protein CERZMDRAFT_49065 [Cercospora zeae-maydis SCOH1-5]|uniref:DUF7582 domain-containing protein n=1 Tax=Cercospora zeae-maydis SCOH1-5 TaxID=717836 RepID=A0A6A6F581_9PEZI|nr:hypothetical protein CERZMDRAFT_49065 [Cercospora zeae-maydis SCOH1-5]
MQSLLSRAKRRAQREEAERPPLQIGSPSDMILHIPRQRLDSNGIPIQATDHEIDRDTMRTALANMAAYLVNKQQNLTVLAIGGAVNLLLLGSRLSTHDLDFLGTHLTNDHRVLLDEAALYAEHRSSQPLGAEWFNNQCQMWLSPVTHRQVTEQALRQNEIVFQQGGLTVIAAPWILAFATKTHRISRSRRGERAARARPYDVTDAALYLRKYILTKDGSAQRKSDVLAQCLAYGFRVDEVDLQAVNNEYRRLFSIEGLVE